MHYEGDAAVLLTLVAMMCGTVCFVAWLAFSYFTKRRGTATSFDDHWFDEWLGDHPPPDIHRKEADHEKH